MNDDSKLIEQLIEFSQSAPKAISAHEWADVIIKLVRDSQLEGFTIVPDGVYRQMFYEAQLFRLEHPNE